MSATRYDAIVIGSGLGGMTAARRLAVRGARVLLVEQHTQLGGLATYFRRRGHIFDVALHGFPIGMKKSFRKYWGREFAERVTQVKRIRFDNPQFRVETTFDTADFTRLLTEFFRVNPAAVEAFFAHVNGMNYYDDRDETTEELFSRFFPGRTDVWRFLMEPITYANGSTLAEPAVSYGIVFSNFMSRGVYTFLGGTETMAAMMRSALEEAGVEIWTGRTAERILIDRGRVAGAVIDGASVDAPVVVSNANLLRTVRDLAGLEQFSAGFCDGIRSVELSNSSCQVYIGIRAGESIPNIGDLLFVSSHPVFDSDALCSREISSRTYSVYYPGLRPGSDRYTVVASMNARYEDWAGMEREAYRAGKQQLIDDALAALDPFVPGIETKVDYTEAATPLTFARYTLHEKGASFGTKFDGLEYSMALHSEISGLFHTGSVGIIMSGWLGAMNYGVITANEAEKYLALNAKKQQEELYGRA